MPVNGEYKSLQQKLVRSKLEYMLASQRGLIEKPEAQKQIQEIEKHRQQLKQYQKEGYNIQKTPEGYKLVKYETAPVQKSPALPFPASIKPDTKLTYENLLKEISDAKKQIETEKSIFPSNNFLYSYQLKQLQKQEEQIRQYQREGYKIRRIAGGYEFYKTPEQVEKEVISKKIEELRPLYDKPSLAGFLHTWSTGILSWEDPFGAKSLYHTLTGQRQKILETKARASIDLDKALKKGATSYIIKSATGPFATIGTTFVGGEAVGAGIGALKAVAPTVGKLTEIGLIGYGTATTVKETTPRIQKALETKNYGELVSIGTSTFPFIYTGIKGYKRGHAFGYGKTEAFLYRLHTYKPGSVKSIRFKTGLKVVNLLKDVKSHIREPIDFTKIERFTPKTTQKTIEYLEYHPETTIGGSTASYTQIKGARVPQDIDILLRPKFREYLSAFKEKYLLRRGIEGKSVREFANIRKVIGAKEFFEEVKTPSGEHLVDIHGEEMYRPGRYHQFGFVSEKPIRIEKYRFFRAGEQLARKGISAIKKETAYRHFKDVPDFITHAESLIESLRQKPFGKFRAEKAEKYLEMFKSTYKKPTTLKPYKSYKIEQFFEKYTKPPRKPEVITVGGEPYYTYPKGLTPKGLTPKGLISKHHVAPIVENTFNEDIPDYINNPIKHPLLPKFIILHPKHKKITYPQFKNILLLPPHKKTLDKITPHTRTTPHPHAPPYTPPYPPSHPPYHYIPPFTPTSTEKNKQGKNKRKKSVIVKKKKKQKPLQYHERKFITPTFIGALLKRRVVK